MNYKITKDNKAIELAEAHINLWFTELKITNTNLIYAGVTEFKSNNGIFLKDCLGNEFGIHFKDIPNYIYSQISLKNTKHSKSFTEIENPADCYQKEALCFLIRDFISNELIGYIQYIPINIRIDNFNNTNLFPQKSSERYTSYKLFCECDSLDDNLSRCFFYLQNTDLNKKEFIKTQILFFNNRFNLLLNGVEMENILSKKIHLDMGEIKISDAEIQNLRVGNVLELSTDEDIVAKIVIGEKEVATATFNYEDGKISLKIISTHVLHENFLKNNEPFSKNMRLVRKFFDEFNSSFEN